MREQPTPEPQNVTRRRFIKRSGGATVGTAIGLYALRTPAWAQEGDDSSGKWWSATAKFSIPLEIDYQALATEIHGQMTTPPPPPSNLQSVAVSTLYPSVNDLMNDLGWQAGGKLKETITQTVVWKEWLTHPQGWGPQPKKFQKLIWIYGGNHIIDLTIQANGDLNLDPGKNFGAILYTEAFFNAASEKWELKGISIVPPDQNTPANDPRHYLTGSVVTPRYFMSGAEQAQPDDKARADYGNYVQHYSVQPQALVADRDWNGTNDVGVDLLEVRHGTQIHARVKVALKDGHTVDYVPTGNGRLQVEKDQNGQPKKARIEVTDWKNQRQTQTKDGQNWGPPPNTPHPNNPNGIVDEWEIWVKRSSGTTESDNFEK